MAESEKVTGIISTIKELNVLELSQLVKALEPIWLTAAGSDGSCCCPRRRALLLRLLS